MTERLANAIYWLGCGAAALLVIVGIWLPFARGDRPDALSAGLIVWFFAVLVYGGGWGLRYIFTGKR